MLISAPISWVIAYLLDIMLGVHGKLRFINTDLKTLIELHTYNALEQLHLLAEEKHKESASDLAHSIGINEDQANIMVSAIELSEKSCTSKMIPIENTFMWDLNQQINDTMELNHKGYSRIPVYEKTRENIVGILRMKDLIGLENNGPLSLKEHKVELRKPLVISTNTHLLDLLREFQKGKSHMALITENKDVETAQLRLGLTRTNSLIKNKEEMKEKIENSKLKKLQILGIITLEDIFEEMVNCKIFDEDDLDKIIKKNEVIAEVKESMERILTY